MQIRFDDVEQCITMGQLKTALALMIPAMKSKEANHTAIYHYINQIITLALKQNDVALAANAAAYVTSYYQFGNPPESAKWNTIIHRALENGGFPKIDFEAKFYEPKLYGPAPSALHSAALEIWRYGKQHNWQIPGCEVKFEASSNGAWSDHPVLAWHVTEIRGKDFVLGFRGRSEQIDGRLTCAANFSTVIAPSFIMQFYDDNSGPSVDQYIGKKNWLDVVSTLSCYSTFVQDPEWRDINCEVPRPGRVYIDHLFDARGNQEEVERNRKSGPVNKREYAEKAVGYLRESVLPMVLKNEVVLGRSF